MTPPPRMHVLIARDAPVAVVFRRGPAKQVATLSWNLKTDEISLGQWLKGRIYAYRSDLSPDGKHMIYFAMNGRWSDAMRGSWTAVSKAPWLTALHVYPWGDCWNGGGLFLDNQRYWLNGKAARLEVACPLKAVDTPPLGIVPHFGECPGIYLPKLARDGWMQTGESRAKGESMWHFEKPVRANWTLRKTFHAGIAKGPNKECYFETYALTGPGQTSMDMQGVEWADIHNRSVLYAKGGALWRMRIHAKSASEAKQVADLSDMQFERRTAPYTGVARQREASA